MSNEQILEGNKLIAEFMGFNYNKPKPIKGLSEQCYSWDVPIDSPLYHICHRSENLYFHRDWNCLMEAYKKHSYITGIWGLRFATRKTAKALMFFDITKAFNSLVEFIKWYNQQNKHQ